MSTTEVLLQSYADIAVIQGYRRLLYQRFGDYQGEWMLFAVGGPDDEYAIYRDWYGSCSGCDALEQHGVGLTSREEAERFASKYSPFALVPRETMRNLVLAETLPSIFPANFREEGADAFAFECSLIARLEEEMPLDAEMALASRNQETRRQIMERIGIEEFVTALLHADGSDKLVTCSDGGHYLWLKDASTPREYLLRVPPDTKTVVEGKAWSFGITPDEYAPIRET